MANLSLAQLRDAQKANPPLGGEWKLNPAWETAPGRFPGFEPDAYKPLNIGPPAEETGCPSPEGSLPLQASPTVQPVSSAGGGFTRIFPPEFPSLLHVPADWKAANWSCNSQWCHVEGAERHPDFESNLRLVEQSPEVVGEFP